MSLRDSARPVCVVRLIVVGDEGKVLILERAEGTHSGHAWCLPGGKLEYGETVADGARRELFEETELRCGEPRFLE